MNAPVKVLLVAPFVVTLTFLAVRLAVAVIVKFAVTVVAFTTVTALAVTPVPDTVTAVVPVKLVPVRVTATTVPRPPLLGVIEVSAGPTTVNVTALLVVPLTVTVMLWAPSVVVAAMLSVAVTVVSFTATKLLTVMLGEPGAFTDVAPVRPMPVMVTGTLVPRAPELGAIDASVGATTVNVTALLGVPPAVTVMLWAPSVVAAAMLSVAVTVVSFTATKLLTVMLGEPGAFTEVAPVSPVPVRVTATLAPRTPDAGAIDVSTGVPAVPPVPWTSTAPMSKVSRIGGIRPRIAEEVRRRMVASTGRDLIDRRRPRREGVISRSAEAQCLIRIRGRITNDSGP